jgi:hypothetical protein
MVTKQSTNKIKIKEVKMKSKKKISRLLDRLYQEMKTDKSYKNELVYDTLVNYTDALEWVLDKYNHENHSFKMIKRLEYFEKRKG